MTRRSIIPLRSPVQGCCCSFIDSSSPDDAADAMSIPLASSSAIGMHRHDREERILPDYARPCSSHSLCRWLGRIGDFTQGAMHELHAAGALTDSGGDALGTA